MTPIAKFLERFVPRPLVVPALALVYAAMLTAVLLVGNASSADNVYLDVNR